MAHPWKEIALADYERHMGLDSVMQLQGLNALMREQFRRWPARTAMVLGVAGGNGLEHAAGFGRVYGVDINPDYLAACAARHPALGDVFTPILADVTKSDIPLPRAELVIADLFVEYVGYACFQDTLRMIRPQWVSCVIQVNTRDGFVSDSPYLHAFDRLSEVHHAISEEGLRAAMEAIGYAHCGREERPLPNGKALLRLDFEKPPELL